MYNNSQEFLQAKQGITTALKDYNKELLKFIREENEVATELTEQIIEKLRMD